jgi:hypothetical protein
VRLLLNRRKSSRIAKSMGALQPTTRFATRRITTRWYLHRLVFRLLGAAFAILQIPFALLELIVSDLAPGIARLENFQGTLFFLRALVRGAPATHTAQNECDCRDQEHDDQNPEKDSKPVFESIAVHHQSTSSVEIDVNFTGHRRRYGPRRSQQRPGCRVHGNAGARPMMTIPPNENLSGTLQFCNYRDRDPLPLLAPDSQ